MAEEINDCEFYREDFSAQSDWEVLNAQLCELLQMWEVHNTNWGRECAPRDLYECKWLVEKEVLNFLTEEIAVTYYRAHFENVTAEGEKSTTPEMFNDLISLKNPFDIPFAEYHLNGIPLLAQLYHLRRFVLIQLINSNNNKKESSNFSTLLNTISVVASEINTSVPIFLQLYESQWCYFTGIGISFNMRTYFDVVTLNGPPNEYRYLSGLLKMFNEKIPNNCKASIVASIKNTYSVGEVKIRMPMYVPFGMIMTTEPKEKESIISVSQFTALPHGFTPNTKAEMYAIFAWPKITANMVIDSPLQTHFTLVNAPCVFLYQIVYGESYLSLCLKDYIKLNENCSTIESYVGRDVYTTNNMSQDLSKVSYANVHIHWQCKSHMEHEQLQQKKIPGPICDYELNQMLYYLFPNMHPDDPLFPYQQIKEFNHHIKSGPIDSFVHRLSCLLAICYAHFGGESGMAQLWTAFVREVNILWNYYLIIPGIMSGVPDPKTCLLHQKLQLLNTCTKRRLQQQNVFSDTTLYSSHSMSNDEDEFYDCVDVENHPMSEETQSVGILKAEGRLKRLGNLKLCQGDDFIYVPITQEVPPKIEDQIENDPDITYQENLDKNSVTQMMCLCLLSDMESFKAANLNATMEDFIRWYSPNDLEEFTNEDGEKSYRLSARMSMPNNTWINMWQSAKPIPASKQKCLFDATKEGLKILQYLKERTLNDVYQLTVIPLIHSSTLKLENIFKNCNVIDILEEYLNSVMHDLEQLSKDIKATYVSVYNKAQFPNFVPIVEKIAKLERIFYQYKCFKQIFNNNSEEKVKFIFKEMLKNDGTYKLKDIKDNNNTEQELNDATYEDFLKVIRNHISASSSHENLISKDYIIRLCDDVLISGMKNTDSKMDTNTPQFLRATIFGDNLRLCGAFTENAALLD